MAPPCGSHLADRAEGIPLGHNGRPGRGPLTDFSDGRTASQWDCIAEPAKCRSASGNCTMHGTLVLCRRALLHEDPPRTGPLLDEEARVEACRFDCDGRRRRSKPVQRLRGDWTDAHSGMECEAHGVLPRSGQRSASFPRMRRRSDVGTLRVQRASSPSTSSAARFATMPGDLQGPEVPNACAKAAAKRSVRVRAPRRLRW